MPKEKEVTKIFDEWIKKVKMDGKLKEQIVKQLPPKYKHRLCLKHD
jgi:ABC-type amino acid transport substrate-binding protein